MHDIRITNARAHNLRGIDVSIPKNQLIVVTGVSGSGKSSLVFDILFEEGRKQYLRSLGILSGLDDEDMFDTISGLAPTIAVQQSIIRQSNPRSTVGSRTRILSLLGVLDAAEGGVTCSSCGTPVDDDLSCGACGTTEERLEARCFSYNAPDGMCMKCSGRGAYYEIDLDRLVPDRCTTLKEVFDSLGMTPGYARLLLRSFGDFLDTPFSELPDEVKEDAVHGHHVDSNSRRRSYCLTRIFEGRVLKYGEDPSGIYALRVCSGCDGFRVGEEARRVLLGGRHIGALGKMTLTETRDWLQALPKRNALTSYGTSLLAEILRKTSALVDSRLGHLSLYREMPSLSGGEIQRLFLSSHLDSRMDSLIYILDEPTVGLHESEKAELLRGINALKELGNTVIVVEHDRNTIEMADQIVDLGPGAGIEGGRVVYQGDFEGLLRCDQSITGQYLSGRVEMPTRSIDSALAGAETGAANALNDLIPCLTLRHARTHNLQDLTVSFPLGVLVGIAGVSGSGRAPAVCGPLLLQLEGGVFRVRRQRPSDDPAGWQSQARQPLSGMRGQEIQRRSSVGALSGKDDRRGIGDARLGGRLVLRGRQGDPIQAGTAGSDRHGLHRARATHAESERRRVSENQDREGARQAAEGQRALCARRAHDRPEPLRHGPTHRAAVRAGPQRELRDRRRA